MRDLWAAWAAHKSLYAAPRRTIPSSPLPSIRSASRCSWRTRSREIPSSSLSLARVAVADAVAPHQDVPVTLGEPLDGLLEGAHFHLPDNRACHLRGTLVFDQLSEFGAVAV